MSDLTESNRNHAYWELISNNKLGEMQEAVLRVIHHYPNSTDSDIARLMGFEDKNKVRPRRNELAEMGLIVPSGTKSDPETRMANTAWKVSYEGGGVKKEGKSFLTNAEMNRIETLIRKANPFQRDKIRGLLQ